MKSVVIGLAAILLTFTVNATGPGGDPGASGYFSDYLNATERSVDWMTQISLYRQEYTDGYAYGWIYGLMDGIPFDCQLAYDEKLLQLDGDAEHAVIHVDPEAIEYCYNNWLPAPITFDCTASGYMRSNGVSNQETAYFDGYNFKNHTKFSEKALDCVLFIGDDIVLDTNSGIVWDGMARVEKYIVPNQERQE